MTDPMQLSADEITAHTWSLFRPNGDCRSPLVVLEPGGKINGYSHPNEVSWAPHEGGLVFLSEDGRVTSTSARIIRNQSGLLEIRMNSLADPDLPAHILVESRGASRDSPDSIPVRAPKQTSPVGRFGKGKVGNIGISLSVPDPAIAYLDQAISRVFFIANNPDINKSVFDSWNLHDADIVIQYNSPVFFDALSEYSCHKLHFHYPNIRSCWGFTDDGRPNHQYDKQVFSSLTFALLNGIPAIVEPYFEELGKQARRMAVMTRFHSVLYSYPSGKLPSCGFASINFFRYLNWIRGSQGNSPIELNMVGFTGDYGPRKAWSGHDFDFEQRTYETWLDVRRLAADGCLVGLDSI